MKPTARAWNVLVILALVLAVFLAAPGRTTVQAAAPTELFFSEYIEGSSNNKALEIFNGTGASINLGTGGYNVQMFFNGSATAALTINLVGTVAAGDVFVVAHSSANATILAQADQTNGAGWFNGDDAVVLRKGTTVIDSFGQVGFDPGAEWGTGLVSTADNTLQRKAGVTAGDTNGTDVFDPSVEWNGFPTNFADGLGSHALEAAPSVKEVAPTNGAINVLIDSDITVTFSEPVNVSGNWFDITCASTGSHTAVVSGGPTTFSLNPDADFANEMCTFTVFANGVTDQDSDDPPDNSSSDYQENFFVGDVCPLAYTDIPAIQGNSSVTPIPGNLTTQGIVVGDFEGPAPTLRGFYIQSLTGDGDDATSDGIFVFNGSNDDVSLGDLVWVYGNANEFQDQTQISATTVAKCGTGSVDPVDVDLPVPSPTFLEQYEGMLVRMPQTLYLTEHFQLGRFGQVVVSSGTRLAQPTNVVEPGVPAIEMQASNNLNRLIIDDALNNQNADPIVFSRDGTALTASNTLRGGDTITGAVGIMTYTWGGNASSPNAYRLRPVNALGSTWDFEPVNPRPEGQADVSGSLRVGALNLLNYFNTFDGSGSGQPWACNNGVGGASTDCRGADDLTEFDRQWPKTVAAILGMNVDVLGIIEIENDGYGTTSAIQDLVNRLNAVAGPGVYAFIDVDAKTEQVNALGLDAIKVGFLYKPAMVTPVGVTAALNSEAFVNGGDGALRNRPALAQAFQQNATGSRFIAVVNHLKSKGSVCDAPDLGDGQGNCNQVRLNAALELASWLTTDPTLTGDPDIVLLGDMNSYAKEDPIAALEDFGFVNLISTFLGPDAYSYVFDGQWGYLDHALGTSSFTAQVTGVAEYHINADEPSVLDYNTNFKSPGQIASLYAPDQFRVSDHDPVIIGLDLSPSPYPSELGFTTGGGWVKAPVDSFFHNPAWTGKAKFEFDVKYKKEDPTPQGSFYLLLEGAGFELMSNSIEWLTISADDKQAIFTGVGSGTYMGETMDYRYMVWMVDGKKDNIRIQVWDGTQLVFDNKSLQTLSGNISVHR